MSCDKHFVLQVDYDNHPHFKGKNMKGSKRGSPVRIFTNISPAGLVLPAKEGYRLAQVTVLQNLFYSTSRVRTHTLNTGD